MLCKLEKFDFFRLNFGNYLPIQSKFIKIQFTIVSLVLLFGFTEIVNCQTTFLKTYGEPGEYADRGYTVKQTADGGYIATGFTEFYRISGTPSQEFGNVYLLKTDSFGEIEWEKSYGGEKRDVAYSLDITDDEGYIISGYTYSFGGYENGGLWVIRTDSFGDTIWTKTFALGQGNCVVQTVDGGYAITGPTSFQNVETYLIKLDSYGNQQWLKTYDLSDSYANYGQCVQQTVDGGFIITGFTVSPTTEDDLLLLKTNSVGDTLWTRTYGRERSDMGRSVIETTDSGYFVTGYTVSPGPYGLELNGWLLKTDSFGDTIWTKIIRKSISDVTNHAIETVDGEYVAVGETAQRNNYTTDIYITKLNNDGEIIWFNTIGDADDTHSYGIYIDKTVDKGFIITGSKQCWGSDTEDVVLAKVNSSGLITIMNEIESELPNEFELYQNYPNPFNPVTSIKYKIPKKGFVNLTVYDILGKKITTLVNHEQNAGYYDIIFDARDLSSGIYFYRLQVDGLSTNSLYKPVNESFIKSKKMILIK